MSAVFTGYVAVFTTVGGIAWVCDQVARRWFPSMPPDMHDVCPDADDDDLMALVRATAEVKVDETTLERAQLELVVAAALHQGHLSRPAKWTREVTALEYAYLSPAAGRRDDS